MPLPIEPMSSRAPMEPRALARRRALSRVALAGVLFGLAACGSRTAIEAPEGEEPDSSAPRLDAASLDLEAGVDPEGTLPLERIAITITVGDDSLGDTDAFRTDVSEAFVFVQFRDGGFVEVRLNEGMTWSAHSMHRRDVEIPLRQTWIDVRSVGIRHAAAGNDWNADNWTMAEVAIASVTESGGATLRYREVGDPVWQFRKNDNQIWEHER